MCEKKKLHKMGDGHPLDMSKMIKAELDAMLEKGYQDALAGRHNDVDKVFDELDRRIDAYYSNKSIKAPIAMGSLTKEEFDAEIAKGLDDIRNGRIFTAEEVRSEMEKDFGI
ncbi:MAG: hypothetical protein ACI3XC_10750 [Phascolarctobacterium sp.]